MNTDCGQGSSTLARWMVAGIVGLSLPVGSFGCTSKPQENQAPVHLRKILQAFDIANYEKKRGPLDMDELKMFLKQTGSIENPDQWVQSPNDGLPYEVIWGVNLMEETDYSAIVAHEKKGNDGKRYVITVSRVVKEMTDGEFSGASFAKARKR